MIKILSLVNSIWSNKIDFTKNSVLNFFSVLSLHAICKRKKIFFPSLSFITHKPGDTYCPSDISILENLFTTS